MTRAFIRDESYYLLQWRHNEPYDVLITGVSIVFSTVVYAQIKRNIRALHHWPLWGELTDDRWILRPKTSNVENVSIWWRHHMKFNRVCQSCLYITWLITNHKSLPHEHAVIIIIIIIIIVIKGISVLLSIFINVFFFKQVVQITRNCRSVVY